jgi:hypothetical protein
MNATLDPPVAFVLSQRAPAQPAEPVRGDGPRRIGLIMADVLARHGLTDAEANAGAPRRSA